MLFHARGVKDARPAAVNTADGLRLGRGVLFLQLEVRVDLALSIILGEIEREELKYVKGKTELSYKA